MTNSGCKRYCEVMNRPAYIVLFKGDDSDFEGNQSVDIVIDTELDTTGMKAHFRFMDFVQDFDSIPENKTLSLVFPNAKTSEFPLGAADATLRFEDASGKFRTVSNRIHIVVTNSVHEAYDNEDIQSITVTVKGTITWEMIQGKPTFATVATSGSYNDLTDKPTIPAPITIDPALSPTSMNPVQNKVVSKALAAKLDGAAAYPEWNENEPYLTIGTVVSYQGLLWRNTSPVYHHGIPPGKDGSVWTSSGVDIKTLKQDALSSEQIGYINDVPNKADKAVPSAEGNLASLNAQGNLVDSGVKPSDFAAKADLPYALVTPSEWGVSSGLPSGITVDYIKDFPEDSQVQVALSNESYAVYDVPLGATELTVNDLATPPEGDYPVNIVLSRLSALQLLDRAVNAVSVTGATTLTLPAIVNAGKARDFIVKVTTSADDLNITWQGQGSEAPNGADELQFVTEDGDFPVVGTAGDYLFSFTEIEPHTFAVSMKPIVAAPQTQGGS